MKVADLILTALIMLTGVEGQDYSFYENDEAWWASRLEISKN